MVMGDDLNDFEENVDDEYKVKYKNLKRKLKENEHFHESLRTNQRKFLKATRDRNFLLERLSQYEPPELTTTDTDETESSDAESIRIPKRRKSEVAGRGRSMTSPPGASKSNVTKQKKKPKTNASSTSLAMVPEVHMDIDNILNNEADKCVESNKKSVTTNKQCITVTPAMLCNDIPTNRNLSAELYEVADNNFSQS